MGSNFTPGLQHHRDQLKCLLQFGGDFLDALLGLAYVVAPVRNSLHFSPLFARECAEYCGVDAWSLEGRPGISGHSKKGTGVILYRFVPPANMPNLPPLKKGGGSARLCACTGVLF